MTKHNKISLKPKEGVKPTEGTKVRLMLLTKKIAKGASMRKVMDFCQEEWGLSEKQSYTYYLAALKFLCPTDEELDEYRKSMIQVQIARLEKIMDKGIESDDPQMLRLAKDCISEISKILGMTEKQKVTIENEKEDQVIKIEFSK